MKCPKCGTECNNSEQCPSCGLIFEKYRRHQEMLAQVQATEPPRQQATAGKSRRFGWLAILLVGGLLIGGYGLLRHDKTPPVAPEPPPLEVAETPPVEDDPTAQNQTVDTFYGEDFIEQLNTNLPPGNPTEKARNATVLIQTSWGLGAGFFINEQCSIITNRHVVQLSGDALAEIEGVIEKSREKAAVIKERIQYAKQAYQKVAAGKGRLIGPVSTLDELGRKIKSDEQLLEEINQEIREKEETLERNRFDSDLLIVLADGTKIDGVIDYKSDESDLALVRLRQSARCPAIPVADSEALRQGDMLLTIGSPMGLRHVVTSGIFSGSVQIEGKKMLQTDAPINPGNSGGPLINSDGKVVGINTLVMGAAQGIGFAIPIEDAERQLPYEVDDI